MQALVFLSLIRLVSHQQTVDIYFDSMKLSHFVANLAIFRILDAGERRKRQMEESKTVVDAFWEWTRTLHPLPNSALGKAISYATGQKMYLNNFLLDGR